MELTNEETVRVFAMYYGAEAVWTKPYYPHKKGGILKVDSDCLRYFTLKSKLLLIPISGITDEHTAAMAKIQGIGYEKPITREHLRGEWLLQYDVRQYLIMEGFEMPLFFGVHHWANGKTAIELRIAVIKN